MDLKSSVLLLILAVSFLPANANDFDLAPEDNPVHVGRMAEFTCVGPAGSTNRKFMINGTQFESLNLTDVTLNGDRILLFTNTPLRYNGTTVQCTLTSEDGEELSSTVGTLLVQGLLDAVSDVIVEYNSSSFIISWTAPFTYKVPFVNPLISYCISITNTSSDSILVNRTCELVNTNYSVELEYDPCVEYSATIIAVNRVGDGEAAVIPFPAPGALLLENFTARAEAGAVIFEGSLPDPVCTCNVTLSVGGAAGTTTNCINSTITFRVMDLNQQFTASVTLTNAELYTTSKITLSSYDVQSIAVDSPAPNAITLNASYLENSPAMGVVFVLLFTDDAGSVNFTKSLYLVLDNVADSSSFIQNNVTQGRYDVLAFDVEEDGRLWSSPAVQETVTVSASGEDLPPFPYPPVPAVISCSTYLNDTDLTVSCDFNNDSVLGYYVLVQFEDLMTGELILLTGETQDDSPVELNLASSNLYNVVVFPLTENGIVGTTVAFMEQVSPYSIEPPTPTSVTSPVSTSATSKPRATAIGDRPLQGLGTGAVAAIVVVLLVVLVLCLLLIFIILCCWFYNRRKIKSTTPEPPPEPEYEEVQERDGIELETNVCYQQNIRPKLNEAYEPVYLN